VVVLAGGGEVFLLAVALGGGHQWLVFGDPKRQNGAHAPQ
jgi:hypothetical protein